jgi:ferredoxin
VTALKLSRDRKVSPRGKAQPGGVRAGRYLATVSNSFGLPAGVSCPGKTAFCVSCYAKRIEAGYTTTADAMAHNLNLLVEAGTVQAMAELLAEMIDRYRVEADRRELTEYERMFRIHWDGDFFSIDYATAWAVVIHANPDVAFWAYTRSFVEPVNVVPVLAQLPNLALYLSVDDENAAAAAAVATEHDVLLAYCATDYRSASALAPQDRQTPVPCPENDGRLELMNDGVGACVLCGICPTARRDIMFSTSHRWDVTEVTIRQRTAIAAGTCGHLECDNDVVHDPGKRGAKPKYCSRSCQVAAYHDRQREQRTAAATA